MRRLFPVLFLLFTSALLAQDRPKVDPPKPAEKATPTAVAAKAKFRLLFDSRTLPVPTDGRAFVMFLNSNPDTVAAKLNWFNPEPSFAKDVKGWKPEEPLILDATAISHPRKLGELPAGRYTIQAVLDRDLGNNQSFSASDGNLYSKPRTITFDPKDDHTYTLELDQVYASPIFSESENIKLVDLPSPLLTRFHAKPMRQRAGVILPPSFAKEPTRKYPVVYEIPGFGGNHTAASRIALRKPWDVDGIEVIWVVLDPDCRLGHHVFADSANNGPVGKAFIDELIPHLEKKYRGNGTRLVTGHSSGGWSSLWLQVNYPEVFKGCWSTSPDPVDFRDFQRVNLYEKGANLFYESPDHPRPLARVSGKIMMTFPPFVKMETLMGHGGQLESFEAVFSPRGPDGNPLRVWDRKTGEINTVIAKTWEKYDIRKILETNWSTLQPKLKDKIHVYMGDEDTFYLDGATRLLKKSLEGIHAEAKVEMFPGKSHALVDTELRKRMNKEMAAVLKGDAKP